MYRMNRRTFVSISALSLGGVVSGCPAAVVPEGVEIVELGAVAAGRSVAAKKIMEYVNEFGKAVLSGLVQGGLAALLDGGNDTSVIGGVASTLDAMESAGYTDRSATVVFRHGQAYFWGVGHRNGFDACMGCVAGPTEKNWFMLEGPAIVGMSGASKGWSSAKMSAADALIPLSGDRPSLMPYDQSFRSPAIYTTAKAQTTINYIHDRNSYSGVVTLNCVDFFGAPVLSAEYPLRYTLNDMS